MSPFIKINITRNENRIDNDDMYILRNQLQYEGVDLLETFPSICVECKSTEKYKIWIQKITGLASTGNYGSETVYWRRCCNCNDSFELPDGEYFKISKIIKLNQKLSSGKISLNIELKLNLR